MSDARADLLTLIRDLPEDQLRPVLNDVRRRLAPAGIPLPDDPSLPFFAYGQFAPGELAFFQIADFVEGAQTACVGGELHERDAMPMLKLDGSGTVEGALLQFGTNHQLAAYGAISTFEPGKFYKWERLAIDGSEVNILAGRGDRWDGEEVVHGRWSGWDDPFFTFALPKISSLVQQATSEDAQAVAVHIAQLDLQMAYQLLWTSIERYLALRYGIGGVGKVMENVKKLGVEPGFVKALQDLNPTSRTVYRSDRPKDWEVLDVKRPGKSLLYYYQVRSNATHRGKAAHSDFKTLHLATKELRTIFAEVLSAAQREAEQIRVALPRL